MASSMSKSIITLDDMTYSSSVSSANAMESSQAAESRNLLEPWNDLRGKIVLVTGASSGLGRDFCLDLAQAGCRIVAAARRVDRLQSLCDQINNLSLPESTAQPRAVSVELDVTADGLTIQRSVQRAWDAFGRIDALINNAGIRGEVKSALDLTEEEWDKTFRTNLAGSWLVSKYVCILMRDSHTKGSVISISSIAGAGRGHLPGGVAYASSKSAISTMTSVMAIELGVHKIRLNSIAPGLFKSEITQGLMKKEWLNNVAERTVPLRTYGTANPALTSIIRFLIHDASQYVTGNNFVVDAGTILVGVPIFSSL